MLAELLAEPDRLAPGITGDVLDEARALVEDAAAAAAEAGGWTAADPLRLSKGPVTWLLRCPRRATADDESLAGGDPTALIVGLLVDAGAKLATLGPTDPVTVERALRYLVATGDGSLLGDVGAVAGDDGDVDGDLPVVDPAVLEEAKCRLDRLLDGWPAVDPDWWPRVEEPVRVRLADGAVTLGGRLDILLGGPPTDRPGLVVEIKSGNWHDAVRSDAHLYGLLLALRDGRAPAAVLSVAAGDGATQLEPLRPAVLLHTAERVAVALGVAAGLAAGEAPVARPGSYCTFCPLLPDCAEGRATAAAAARPAPVPA